jgi:hypothetical protein
MKMKTFVATAATALALASATPALAVTNFLSTFDGVPVNPGQFVIVSSADGWNATSGGGIELQNHAAGTPFSEANLVELDSSSNSTMTRLIDAGKYVLSGQVSARPGVGAASSGLDILLNNIVLNSQSYDGTGLADTAWNAFSFAFTVHAPTMLSFRATGTDDSLGAYLDNIGLVGTPVPEAATWAMLILGLGLVGGAMRRRRNTNVRNAF